MSGTTRAEISDTAIAMIIAAFGTWALPHFLFNRLLQFTWWMYLVLFLGLLGGLLGGLAKQRAIRNAAYGREPDGRRREG